jgi:hypothetical protein
MSDTLPPEVRVRVDAHLDAVESELRTAGADRTKRRGIVDDLETQILDMLAAHKTESATLADVDAVLAKLDPPSAYASTGSVAIEPRQPAMTPVVAQPRLCPVVGKGTRYLAVALVGALVLILYKAEYDFEHQGGLVRSTGAVSHTAMTALLMIAGLAAVAGPVLFTAFGWIATERIRRSCGREYGLGLAVIEALLFPTLIIWLAAFALSRPGGGFLECFVAPVLLTAGLAFLLRWATGPKSRPAGWNGRSEGTGKVPLTSN